MSLLYSTDRNILRTIDLTEGLVNTTQFKWHETYDMAHEKGVSDSHFRTYMENESGFNESDVFLYDCLKAGVMKFESKDIFVNVARPQKENDILIDDEDSLDDEEISMDEDFTTKKSKAYTYSIDLDNPKTKNMILKYVEKEAKQIGVYNKNAAQTLLVGLVQDLNSKGIEVKDLDVAFYGLTKETEKIVRDNLNVQKQTDLLRNATNRAIEYKQSDETSKNKDHAMGAEVLEGLKGAIIAHRNRSTFFAIFHPFQYLNEKRAIENAKNALVTLGADREKVNTLAEHVKEQDVYFRDKKDDRRAESYESLFTNVKFSDLSADVDLGDLDDDLIMEDSEDEKEIDMEFTESLKEATTEKTVAEPMTNINDAPSKTNVREP